MTNAQLSGSESSLIKSRVASTLYLLLTLHYIYITVLSCLPEYMQTFPPLWSGFCCAPELQQSLTITRTQTIEALITDERNQ